MDEYKYCLNTLLSKGSMLQTRMTTYLGDEVDYDKEYEEIVKWFKDNYELKRRK